MSSSTAKLWLPAICAATLALATPGAMLQAATLVEVPSPQTRANTLVRSMLSAPEFEPAAVLMADESSLRNAVASPICGNCDLSAASQEPPVNFAPIVSDVPEPASVVLAGLGLAGLLSLRRRT